MKTNLEGHGFKPEIHDLTWFQDDYGLKVDDGDDEQDDGGDDDDDDDEEGDDGDEGSDEE